MKHYISLADRIGRLSICRLRGASRGRLHPVIVWSACRRHWCLLLCFCLLSSVSHAQNVQDSLALVNADWHWKDLGKGARSGYALVPMFGDRQSISVVKYPARKFKTFLVDAQHPQEDIVPVIARRGKAKAAVNASYFDVKRLIPSTYFALNGKRVGETYANELFRANGYVALKDAKGRQMEIGYTDTTRYSDYPKQYHALLVSGPVVLVDGHIPAFPSDRYFTHKRHPRSVVGYDDQGNIYYVVIDGRFPRQGACGATIPEVACIARYLGMKYALNLDGGGSSTLWTEKEGVINHPYDNKKFDHEGCRKVPNILMMK